MHVSQKQLLLNVLNFYNCKLISQMADFQLDIKEIQTQDSALTIAEIFVDAAIDEKGLKKEFVHAFFSSALHNLENQAISPKTKFYTLFIIKELSIKDKVTLKIFGTFAQHPLYAYLQELAFTVDPKKPVSDKGKNLFPTDKQTGNNFMRLLLESMVSWGSRFVTNSKKEPTLFRRTYTKLTDEKIVLPKDLIYYPNGKKTQRSQTPQGPKQSGPDPISNKGVSNDSISNPTSIIQNVTATSKPKQSKEKHLSQIRFMQNKIQSLIEVLEDAESVEELQREIQSYHLKFEKDLKKLQEIESDILETTDESLMQLYFNAVQFFHEEARLFRQNVSKNEYDVYSTGCHIAFQRVFKKSPSKIEPSIDKKMNQVKVEKGKPGLPPHKPSIEKIKTDKSQIVTEKQNIRKKPSEKEPKESRPPERENKLNNKNNPVQTYFSKLQAKSRQQPQQGFNAIAKSLTKEKKPTVASRMKTSNVITSLNKSKFTGGSNFSKSVVKGIFAAPPNPTIRPKSYEGELVVQNLDLQRQFEQIRKEQGVRRVKASFFKNKYIIFEDENVQVGFKSSPIYEKVDKFTTMLDFQLFFGNKTTKTINNFQTSFKGDKQSLIYTSPQVVENRIYPESQIKLQLLNIPKSYPFGLIVLNASYEYLEQTRYISALLPNSIMQLTTYFKLDKDCLQRIWSECPKILKTDQFKLSHHFPPDEISRFLPMLKETTPYSKFAEEGSTVDYQLYCQLVIGENLEGVLKIVIRPDLSAIIQVGIYSADEESESSFKFYLQTLQGVLRELQA